MPDKEPPVTTELHRGRVQAQGKAQPQTKTPKGKIEESVAWASETPPTVSEMMGYLEMLRGKLSPAEQKIREECFEQARRYVKAASVRGGVSAPVSKSWRNKALRGGVRVNLEVQTGIAAVPDEATKGEDHGDAAVS